MHSAAIRSTIPDASRDRRLLLDSIAGLVPTLAHEMKNPLAVLQSAADMLADSPLDAASRGDVETITEAVERLRDIIDRYGAIGEKLIRGRNTACVDVVPSILALVQEEQQRLARLAINVSYHGPKSAEVRVSSPLLLAILDHLVRNAREAVRTGDKITVTLDRSDPIFTLSVTDSGPGMHAADLARATELFFTNKRGHAGIGLALTREIVERSGGEFVLFSEPGAGTEALVRLPAA